jgi:hypothetical protein
MPVDSRVIIYGLAFLISKSTSHYFASARCRGQQVEPANAAGNERISLLNIVFLYFGLVSEQLEPVLSFRYVYS